MLSVLGVLVFLALFIVQLVDPAGGHLRKTYIVSALTPCSDHEEGCQKFSLDYADKKWPTDFNNTFDKLMQDNSVCPCLVLSSRTRKYVMNDFPCADFVPLCNNSVQFEEKWDVFAANATCFPTPYNATGKASKIDVPGFYSLSWNFTLNKTMVQAVGTAFCDHTKRVTIFQVNQVYAMLLPALQWRKAVVESLRNELSRHFDLALSPMVAAEASPAEVTYAKAYLEWLSYRIYAYALTEPSGLDGAPEFDGTPLPEGQGIVLAKPLNHPLVIPLWFHQRVRALCGDDSQCVQDKEMQGVMNSSVWQFDFYEFATKDCSPVQCSRVKIRRWYIWVSDIAALAGGLSHTVFFVLPVIWAIVMAMLWCHSTQPGGRTSNAPDIQARRPLPHQLCIICFGAWSLSCRQHSVRQHCFPVCGNTGLMIVTYCRYTLCALLVSDAAIFRVQSRMRLTRGFCYAPICLFLERKLHTCWIYFLTSKQYNLCRSGS